MKLKNCKKVAIVAFALTLSPYFSSDKALAKQEVLTKSQLPDFAKEEAQGKLAKIELFTSKSGKYKIVAFTRKRGKKGKLQTRMVAYELLKGAEMASVIRSTKFKAGSDYKFKEVSKWKYKNNPVLLISKNIGDNKIECEVYVFDGPEMKQVNSIETSKISIDRKAKKGEPVLVSNGDKSGKKSDLVQKYRWNGEKLVKI